MRKSPLQHPVAVLRTQLGIGQKEFGERVGRHWRTIQSIELGKLPLSAKLAERICDETSVNFYWLMKGDPEAPIIDERGLPWKVDAFFDAQGRKLLPGTRVGRHYAIDLLDRGIAKLCAAMVAAAASKNIRSHTWRLITGIDKAVEDLKDFTDIEHHFNQILVDHAKDSQAAREAMIAEAVRVLRQWREPRGRNKRGLTIRFV